MYIARFRGLGLHPLEFGTKARVGGQMSLSLLVAIVIMFLGSIERERI